MGEIMERDVERGDRLEWCVNFMGKSVWMNRYTTGTHSIGVYELMKNEMNISRGIRGST